MQASLETEQRAKAETLRLKKKLEGQINELEIALDHANKANNEAQKSIKRYQVNFIEICALEEFLTERSHYILSSLKGITCKNPKMVLDGAKMG